MTRSFWSRLLGRRRKRYSFYETQHAMRRAVEESPSSSKPPKSPSHSLAGSPENNQDRP